MQHAAMMPIEATYADAVALSHALFMELEIEGRELIFHGVAVRFWLQHSDCAVVLSLGVVVDGIDDAWM